MLLDAFSYIFDLCKVKCMSIESDVVLQVCRYPDARRNVVPILPHGFQCCWGTCKQSFNNPETYFNHVKTHVYCNPRGRKVEGVPCHWRGEF